MDPDALTIFHICTFYSPILVSLQLSLAPPPLVLYRRSGETGARKRIQESVTRTLSQWLPDSDMDQVECGASSHACLS